MKFLANWKRQRVNLRLRYGKNQTFSNRKKTLTVENATVMPKPFGFGQSVRHQR